MFCSCVDYQTGDQLNPLPSGDQILENQTTRCTVHRNLSPSLLPFRRCFHGQRQRGSHGRRAGETFTLSLLYLCNVFDPRRRREVTTTCKCGYTHTILYILAGKKAAPVPRSGVAADVRRVDDPWPAVVLPLILRMNPTLAPRQRHASSNRLVE